jgi:hypothetical protein
MTGKNHLQGRLVFPLLFTKSQALRAMVCLAGKTAGLRMKENPMAQPTEAASTPGFLTSALVLSDRLLALAQDADRAGYQVTAGGLVQLAHRVFDEPHMPA